MVKKGAVQMKCWVSDLQLPRLSARFHPLARLDSRHQDIGGQAQYRSEWGRYTRGCDVIIYVVDAHAVSASSGFPLNLCSAHDQALCHHWPMQFDRMELARKELHRLLEDRELATTPLLIIANKIDLDPHISEPELIRELNLDYIVDNPWIVIPTSALKVVNIDQVVDWLTKQSS